MSSAAEYVFYTVELLEQVLYGLDIEDILIFQRINKAFRENILRTRALRRRASYGLSHQRGVISFDCIFGLSWPNYRGNYDRFLCLEPFKLSDGMCLRACTDLPKIFLEYDYTPRSTKGSLPCPSDCEYPDTGSKANIGVWRGEKLYEKSQSWTNIWLPCAAVEIILHYWLGAHSSYTQTKVLESDKANIHSIAECLEDLAKESEKAWASMAV